MWCGSGYVLGGISPAYGVRGRQDSCLSPGGSPRTALISQSSMYRWKPAILRLTPSDGQILPQYLHSGGYLESRSWALVPGSEWSSAILR